MAETKKSKKKQQQWQKNVKCKKGLAWFYRLLVKERDMTLETRKSACLGVSKNSLLDKSF